jgi:large subunit ribosomal protein L13
MSPILVFILIYYLIYFTPILIRYSFILPLAATMDKSLGPDKWNDTYYPTGADAAAVHKRWYIVDAEGQTLGRLATLVTDTIRGKNSVGYTPSMDMGSFVIVINAEKVAVTGAKETDKTYFRHTTGRPGGGKIEALRDLRVRIPERIIEKAVRGMLPNGRLGNSLYTHLKVYKGASHPHTAQKPVDITHNISKKPAEVTPL